MNRIIADAHTVPVSCQWEQAKTNPWIVRIVEEQWSGMMDGIIAQNADMPMKTMKMTISIMKAKKKSIRFLIGSIPMPYDEYAQCPDCGKTAHGKDEIEKLL
jgi:hypothetical protein